MSKEEQSQELGPWTQYTYDENVQVTEKGKDRSKGQVIEYYCVAYLDSHFYKYASVYTL